MKLKIDYAEGGNMLKGTASFMEWSLGNDGTSQAFKIDVWKHCMVLQAMCGNCFLGMLE